LETVSRLLRSPLGQAVISFLLGYLATTKLSQMYGKLKRDSEKFVETKEVEDSEPIDDSELSPKGNEVVLLTSIELTAFDGLNPEQPIYTALNGLIYDLSPGREKFSCHGPYFFLAGCNANKVLNIACRSMGVCANDVIKRWEQSLNAEFNIVGYLIDGDVENTSEDLEIDQESENICQTEPNN